MALDKTTVSAVATRVTEVLQTPKAKRYGKGLAIFFVVFGLLGFFAAPPLVKSILLKQLSAELQREVSIETIDINPYALSARVGGLSVKSGEGKEVFGFDELLINVSTASLFQFGAIVDEVRLQGPRVAVARVAEGRYDISDLLDKWMQPKEESPTPRFSLNNIRVSNGKITFDDQPKGKVHGVTDINLNLPFVSSLPYQANITVEPKFSATVLDSPVQLLGKAKPFSPTHESELNLDVEHFDLSQLKPYFPDSLPVRLLSGMVDSELKLVFKQQSDQVFSLSLVGNAYLSNFALSEAAGQPLLGWKKLDVELADTDLVNRRFAVQRLVLDGLDAHVAVSKNGELNWLQIADKLSARPETSAAAPAAPARPVVWSLDEFRLNNGLVHWKDESNGKPLQGEIGNIEFVVGKVDSKLSEPVTLSHLSWGINFGDRLKAEQISLKEVKLDLSGHRVDVGELANKPIRIGMLRNKEGKLDWINPPALKTAKKAPTEKAEAPWIASLNKLALTDVVLRLEDQSISPAAVQVIDGFSFNAENLTTEAGKKGKLALKARINQKGSLSVDGNVQLTPLAANLQLETVAVPLLPLQPYVTDMLNISLTRGQLSNKGELSAEQGKNGLNARYKGSLTLGDLLTVDKVNNADFLKWKSFYIGNIDFNLLPMSVNVGEVALTDFYSRLIVGKDGQLNLANIVKKPVVAEGETKAAATEPVPAPQVGKVAEKPEVPMPIKIAKVTLQGGTVNFSDFFVKPNYTANLTKVGGRVTGLSSTADSVADMELRGSYANSAPVLVLAKLNPFAAKSYLDLKADVSGVDLVPMSPYSGKYAGYNIDKGKLSLNVAYKLENGQLSADNRLFIDQLTFGSKVESPTATSLPVNLAISLLKNNRGEIDLNLPISGSLDDPQFSIGGLVIKVIVNLFVKAVTSPFALLGSMFGGGEELSNIEFAPGRSAFSDAANKKLEALAKALKDRESLKLEITGRADPEVDKDGIKWVAIDRAVRAEKQKDLIKKGSESGSLDSIEIGDAEYPLYLERAYKEAKFPKPRNMIGLLKDLPREEMEKLMLANLPATPDDMRLLAMRRAEHVQGWLLEQGKVAPERIFLLPPKLETDEKAKANRVDFSLR